MKGLIVKELRMLKKSWVTPTLLIVIFTALAIAGEISFVLILPLFLSIFQFSFLTVDEQCKWQQYSFTLPYERKNIVTAKYTMFFILLGFSEVIMTIAYLISSIIHSDSSMKMYINLMIATCILGLVYPTLMLPLAFKFNSNKSRIIILFVNGTFGGCVAAFCVNENVSVFQLSLFDHVEILLMIILAVVVFLYCISWLLSIKIYEKKDF